MIMRFDEQMPVKLAKLIKKIFKTSYYPNSQKEGLICAFHKSKVKETQITCVVLPCPTV